MPCNNEEAPRQYNAYFGNVLNLIVLDTFTFHSASAAFPVIPLWNPTCHNPAAILHIWKTGLEQNLPYWTCLWACVRQQKSRKALPIRNLAVTPLTLNNLDVLNGIRSKFLFSFAWINCCEPFSFLSYSHLLSFYPDITTNNGFHQGFFFSFSFSTSRKVKWGKKVLSKSMELRLLKTKPL